MNSKRNKKIVTLAHQETKAYLKHILNLVKYLPILSSKLIQQKYFLNVKFSDIFSNFLIPCNHGTCSNDFLFSFLLFIAKVLS